MAAQTLAPRRRSSRSAPPPAPPPAPAAAPAPRGVPAQRISALRRQLREAKDMGRGREAMPAEPALQRCWKRGRLELERQMDEAEVLAEADGAAWLLPPKAAELGLRIEGRDVASITVWGDPEDTGWIWANLLDTDGLIVPPNPAWKPMFQTIAGAARALSVRFDRALPRIPLSDLGRR